VTRIRTPLPRGIAAQRAGYTLCLAIKSAAGSLLISGASERVPVVLVLAACNAHFYLASAAASSA
jgi:hypothetical protein